MPLTSSELWLSIAVVYLLALLPGVAYGFYRRSFIKGLGVTSLILFVLAQVNYVIEPRQITADRWAYVHVVPLLAFWKVFVDRREFFRAWGWYGIVALIWLVVRAAIKTFAG